MIVYFVITNLNIRQ